MRRPARSKSAIELRTCPRLNRNKGRLAWQKKTNRHPKVNNPDVVGLRAEILEQVTETLEVNYMPYAMSVIVSRAIPEIDGFSPRTARYFTPCTRWGCLQAGEITNIVGQTMRLNPTETAPSMRLLCAFQGARGAAAFVDSRVTSAKSTRAT